MTREDFAPYREEISGCHCATCTELAQILNSALYSVGAHGEVERHRTVAFSLLSDLRSGRHARVSLTEYVEQAKQAKAERLEEARARGAGESELSAIERGYGHSGSLWMRE